jgi:class 3 adenylate cyclase
MAFQNTTDALEWCMEAQQELVKLAWPEALLDHPGAAEEWGDTDDRVLFKGLRVRMGVHVGQPRMVRDPMTRRVEYIGPVINAAARITAMTHGGQILLSGATFDKVRGESELASKKAKRMVCLGKFEMPDSPKGTPPRPPVIVPQLPTPPPKQHNLLPPIWPGVCWQVRSCTS